MESRDKDTTNLIGKRLREIRLQNGQTIIEVAEKAGIVRGTLQNYEYGERQPSLGLIRKLAVVLKTSPAYIAGLVDYLGDNSSSIFVNANPLVTGRPTVDNDPIAFNVNLLESKGLNANTIAIFEANDDLMLPLFKEGDSLLVDTSINKINKTDVYALRTQNNAVLFRHCRPHIGNGAFTVYASNTEHFPAIEIAEKDQSLIIIGRIACIAMAWR